MSQKPPKSMRTRIFAFFVIYLAFPFVFGALATMDIWRGCKKAIHACWLWFKKAIHASSRRFKKAINHRKTIYIVLWLVTSILCFLVGLTSEGIRHYAPDFIKSLSPDGYMQIWIGTLVTAVAPFQPSLLQVLFNVGLIFAIVYFIRNELGPDKPRNAGTFVWGWLLAMVVTLQLSAPFTEFALENFGIGFFDTRALLIAVTVVALIFYVWHGDNSDTYAKFVNRHKWLWIAFLCTLLFVLVQLNFNFNYVSGRVESMVGARRVLIANIQTAEIALAQAQTKGTQLYYQLRVLYDNPTPTPASKPANPPLANTERGGVPDSGDTSPISSSGVQESTPLESATPEFKATELPATLVPPQRDPPEFLLQSPARAIKANHAAAALALERAWAELPLVQKQESDLMNEIQLLHQTPGADTQAANAVSATLPFLTATKPITVSPGTSLVWSQLAIQEALTVTNELSSTLQSFTTDIDAWDSNALHATSRLVEFRLRMENEMLPGIARAQAVTRLALGGTRGTEFAVQPIFMATAVLLGLFVLMPWMLLLLFIFRKRDNLATGIVNDLLQLSPDRTFLKRVLDLNEVQIENGRDGASVWHTQANGVPQRILTQKDVDASETGSDAGADPQPSQNNSVQPGDNLRKAEKTNTDPTLEQVALLKSIQALPTFPGGTILVKNDGGNPQPNERVGVRAFNLVRDALARRTFNDFEYIMTLTVLSAILGVGWYFVFYPNTSIGLAILMLQNAGIETFTSYLAQDLTPITMGFVGAYLWISYMLLRRYFYGDLYPSAYLQAILRFLIVFVLTLGLTAFQYLVIPNAGDPTQNVVRPIILLLAFVIGMFPDDWQRHLVEVANAKLGGKEVFPESMEKAPLVKLEGINRFIETRLLEENIENVQELATAHIQELVVNTYFPASQIVDWIDQAILYIHCGNEGERFEPLRAANIRTATDFLDALGYNLMKKPYAAGSENQPPSATVKALLDSILDANAGSKIANTVTGYRLRDATRAYLVQVNLIVGLAERLVTKAASITATPPNEPSQNESQIVSAIQDKLTELVHATEPLAALKTALAQRIQEQAYAADIKQDLTAKFNTVAAQQQPTIDAATNAQSQMRQVQTSTADWRNPDAAWRQAIAQANTQARALQEQVNLLERAVQAYTTPVISEAVLRQMYDAILPDPNLIYVLNWHYWQLQSAPNLPAAKKQQTPPEEPEKLSGPRAPALTVTEQPAARPPDLRDGQTLF